MKKLLFILCLFALACSSVQSKEADDKTKPEQREEKPYCFIHLSDPQFGFIDNNNSMTDEVVLMEKACTIINRLKPDFVVITGDMVNASKSKTQIEAFKNAVSKIDSSIPVHLIPGNHDISNTADKAQTEAYKSNYGEDKFSFSHKSSRFIGLNSCVIKENNPDYEPLQFKWLEKELAKSKNSTFKFIFSHYSFFLKSADEGDKYSNIPLTIRGKYLDLFHKYGVTAIFAGHLHDLSMGVDADLQMITIGALGKALGGGYQGMNLVKVYPDHFTHEYIALDKFPENVSF